MEPGNIPMGGRRQRAYDECCWTCRHWKADRDLMAQADPELSGRCGLSFPPYLEKALESMKIEPITQGTDYCSAYAMRRP